MIYIIFFFIIIRIYFNHVFENFLIFGDTYFTYFDNFLIVIT